jgi:hypothetical protein
MAVQQSRVARPSKLEDPEQICSEIKPTKDGILFICSLRLGEKRFRVGIAVVQLSNDEGRTATVPEGR